MLRHSAYVGHTATTIRMFKNSYLCVFVTTPWYHIDKFFLCFHEVRNFQDVRLH